MLPFSPHHWPCSILQCLSRVSDRNSGNGKVHPIVDVSMIGTVSRLYVRGVIL